MMPQTLIAMGADTRRLFRRRDLEVVEAEDRSQGRKPLAVRGGVSRCEIGERGGHLGA